MPGPRRLLGAAIPRRAGTLVLLGSLFAATSATAAVAATGMIGSAQIRNNSVLGIDIRNSTITSADVRNSTLTGRDIRDGSIGTYDIADGSITANDLADGLLGAAGIADGTIVTAHLADGAVTGAKLASGSVGASQLRAGAVSGASILDASITGADIAHGTIGANQLADGAVAGSKLAPGSVEPSRLASVPFLKLVDMSALTLHHSTVQYLGFDTEVSDTDDMHSPTAADSDAITAPRDGIYHVEWIFMWDTAATDCAVHATIQGEAGIGDGVWQQRGPHASAQMLHMSSDVMMSAGEHLELSATAMDSSFGACASAAYLRTQFGRLTMRWAAPLPA